MFDDGSSSLSLIVMVNNSSLALSFCWMPCRPRANTDSHSLIHALLCFPHLFPSLLSFSWSHMKILLLLLLGKTDMHLTTIIWGEKKRRCVDLIDSIIFSRSTWWRSKTMLRRCTHTQEKHYRWHTHIYTFTSLGAKEKREVGCAYSSHRQKSEKSIMLVGCVYCAMHSSFLYMCRYVRASLYWNMLLFLIHNPVSARVYMPAYSCCISLS